MYIDKDYYDNDYQGIPMDNEEEFNRCVKRASDAIDELTGFSIVEDKLIPFQLNMVKKATAIMTEHFIMNGGYESSKQSDGMTSVSIGPFSYSAGDSASSSNGVTSNVTAYLDSAGLMYRGIGVYHGC